MPVLWRDCEVQSVVNLKAAGTFRYACNSSTSVLCYGFAVDDGPVKVWLRGEPVPAEFFEAKHNREWTVAAFNDPFETAIEKYNLAPLYGWPLVPIERHRCIQAQALAHALPASLEGAAQALNLPYTKDTKGRRILLLFYNCGDEPPTANRLTLRILAVRRGGFWRFAERVPVCRVPIPRPGKSAAPPPSVTTAVSTITAKASSIFISPVSIAIDHSGLPLFSGPWVKFSSPVPGFVDCVRLASPPHRALSRRSSSTRRT
jgi:hypothetical protein